MSLEEFVPCETASDGADVTFCRSVPQSPENYAETGKARLLTVESRVPECALYVGMTSAGDMHIRFTETTMLGRRTMQIDRKQLGMSTRLPHLHNHERCVISLCMCSFHDSLTPCRYRSVPHTKPPN